VGLRFVALREVDLEHLGRSAGLARKAVGEAPFGAILIGADGVQDRLPHDRGQPRLDLLVDVGCAHRNW
jgi:hypothetical protein